MAQSIRQREAKEGTSSASAQFSPPKLQERLQADFTVLKGRQRPNSTSADFQYFLDKLDNKTVWIGKSSNEALYAPPYPPQRYFNEYKEWVGLAIYQLLGIPTPQIALSLQYPVRPQDSVPDLFDYSRPCLHVMSRLVEGFQPFGTEFLANYQETTQKNQRPTVTLNNGEILPIKGFGEAIAAGCFIYDMDCLGGGGGNMGFVIANESTGQHYAKTIKIDSGDAFNFLKDFADSTFDHDPRQRDMFYAPGKTDINAYYTLQRDPSQKEITEAHHYNYIYFITADETLTIGFFDQHDQFQKKAVTSTKKADFLVALTTENNRHFNTQGTLTRIRQSANIQIAFEFATEAGGKNPPTATAPQSRSNLLRYDQLSPQDQLEFSTAARRILQIPKVQFEQVLNQVLVKDGFSQQQANELITRLLARKAIFLTGFLPEVSDQIRQEAFTAKEIFLAQLLTRSPTKTSSQEISFSTSLSVVEAECEEKVAVGENKEKHSSHHSFNQALETRQQEHLVLLRHQEEAKQSDIKKVGKKSGEKDTFQIPTVAPHFTGREEALARLIGNLYQAQSSVVSQGISGMGGVGKTQLAAHFVQQALHDRTIAGQQLQYDAILWLYAENPTHLGLQFQTLAELWCGMRDLPGKEAIYAVYRYLENKRALIIFDNAENKEKLIPYLPPTPERNFRGVLRNLLNRPNCLHLLITSRNPTWEKVPTLLLGEFNQTEATQFIQQYYPQAAIADINSLIATVSALPLALTHAMAYIKAGHCGLAEYPQQFFLHQLSLGRHLTTANAAVETILTTFLLSAGKLEKTHPGTLEILQTFAFLAADNIPLLLITAAWEEAGLPQQRLQSTLDSLIKNALITPGNESNFSIHRLIQESIQQTLVPDKEKLMTVLIKIYPKERELQGTTHDKTRIALAPHLKIFLYHYDKSPALIEAPILATFLENLGNACVYMLEQREEGRNVLERALTIRKKHLGDNHPEVADILISLGNATDDNLTNKKHFFAQALAIYESHYGGNHSKVAIALIGLGTAYCRFCEFSTAREVLERALSIQERQDGPSHWRISVTLQNLAIVYGNLGDVARTRDLLERALKIRETHYGLDHYEIAAILIYLGAAYSKLGNVSKERDLLERALKIQEAHYGADNYKVANILSILGSSYVFHGNLNEVTKGQDLLERALKIQEAHYGLEHYQVATTLNRLGVAYGHLGDMVKKRDLLERALKIEEAHYGPINPQITTALTNLAAAYYALQQPEAALQASQRLYRILMAHPDYGVEHPQTKEYLSILESQCGFSLADLKSGSALVDEKSSSQSQSSTHSTSLAQLSTQQGFANQGVQQVQQSLGQAVLALLAAIDTQRQPDWNIQAHANFTATVVSAFAKGGVVFQYLCANPELNSIPAALGQFI